MKRQPLIGIVISIGLLILLECICRLGFIDIRFFPSPSSVFFRLFEILFQEPEFKRHLAASGDRYIYGVVLSLVLALPLAGAAGLSRTFRLFLNSMLGVVYPLPKSAIFPFFLLVFGLNNGANVALILSGSLTLMLTALIAGCVRLEAAGYFALADTLNLSVWKRFRFVLMPGLLPELFHGLKLGTSYGLVLLVVSEMVATRFGIGVFMWSAWDQFHILDLYAVLYLVSMIGIFLFVIFEAAAEFCADAQKGL